jgi:hypothetical protein
MAPMSASLRPMVSLLWNGAADVIEANHGF